MKEDLLHYAWRLQRFGRDALQTTTGEPIEILHAGTYNTHAGPDFLNARIRIGDTLWAGNVEMHLRASDWLKHGHHEDRAYDNVILHVVMEEDTPVHHARGERIPCLEMKKRIPQKLAAHYLRLLNNEDWIACEGQFAAVSELTRNLWLERLAAERLEQKALAIARQLEQNKENWEETFYHFLARSFGARVNAEPFMMLAQRCPLLLLRKHRHSLFQMEALLFGQSGLLTGPFAEEYPQQLQKEYRFLRRKYKLQPLPPQSWKFLRLRPANFPTLRIAQLAALLFQSDNLFSKVMAAINMTEVENIFEVKLSNYWWTHYTFDKASDKKQKALGREAIHLIFINTIAPFLFLYGQRKGEEKYQERALELLAATRPEANAVIRRWRAIGATAESAFQTQALLQLKNEYCDKKRCLECAVGNAVLQRE
ncbi:MAG: DUF2851 family protein [Phaeodactylibacter sp.]|nr:DUF2851 family protein [Phaeodactylibacter sp.]